MNHLKVAHWNCLADHLAEGFPKVNPKWLTWDHRRDLILAKIRDANADIVSLVEVDKFDEILASLRPLGYHGQHAFKQGSNSQDGTAIFFKTEIVRPDLFHITKLIASGSQIGVLVRFTHIQTKKQFFFGALHLKAKPGNEQYRRYQLIAFCQALEKLADPKDPVIMTGDFNDVPESPCYQLMRNLGFSSAYGLDKHYTTFKTRQETIRRTIDYIWARRLTLVSTDPIPDPENFPECGLPCEHYPSDHLMIGATYSIE